MIFKHIITAGLALLCICSSVCCAQSQLPLHSYHPPKARRGSPLIFLLSGDGGWNDFTENLAQGFSSRGFEVLGIDSKKYFWEEKTPQKTASEFNAVIAQGLQQYQKKQYVIVGFSFGACITPFLISHTGDSVKSSLKAAFLVSPDKRGDFEIHITDMLSLGDGSGNYDVLAETAKQKQGLVTCIFGAKENRKVVKAYRDLNIPVKILPGNHHYDEKPANIVRYIVRSVSGNKIFSERVKDL